MKNKCFICTKSGGKRKCKLKNNEIICPRCCASIRTQECCEGCFYYKSAENFHANKLKGPQTKHFIIELNEEVQKSVDNALELIERKSFNKGEAILTDLNKNHPRNHLVQYAMGVLYACKGQNEEAIKYFEKAIDIFPYFIEAHFNKAVAYQKELDIGNMIKAYQKVVELGDPKDQYVQQAKAFLFDLEQNTLNNEGINLETYVKGSDIFEKAINSMNNQEWKKAIYYFEECLKINKRHPQSYGNLGICYSKSGHKEEALKAFDKALEIDPNYELAIVNRSFAESMGESEKLNCKVDLVEYYKEYPMKKKSYIQSIIENSRD